MSQSSFLIMKISAEIDFSLEYAIKCFEGINVSAGVERRQNCRVVNLVRCSNTRVVYEKAVADVAAKMIENNILVLTNCCASFPL